VYPCFIASPVANPITSPDIQPSTRQSLPRKIVVVWVSRQGYCTVHTWVGRNSAGVITIQMKLLLPPLFPSSVSVLFGPTPPGRHEMRTCVWLSGSGSAVGTPFCLCTVQYAVRFGFSILNPRSGSGSPLSWMGWDGMNEGGMDRSRIWCTIQDLLSQGRLLPLLRFVFDCFFFFFLIASPERLALCLA
jgi:hypothetical protein